MDGLFFSCRSASKLTACFVMKRKCLLEEIRAEMQRRIDVSDWGNGYCSGCPAPTPYRIPYDGIANWTANIAATPRPGCQSLILRVVADVRSEYDLPPEDINEQLLFRQQARRKD
jgi:hypothetical protein